MKNVKGDCVLRRTTSDNVKAEPTRSSMAPSAPQTPKTDLHSKDEQSVCTSKKPKSSTAAPLNSPSTNKERNQSRAASTEHSAEFSASTSSNRTYRPNEYEKLTEKVEADAGNLNDKLPSHPAILVQKPSGNSMFKQSTSHPISNRRYSQVSGGTIAQEIVSQVDGDMNSQIYSEKQIAARVHKMENFVERRSLSGFARKRLIDSARGTNRVATAC